MPSITTTHKEVALTNYSIAYQVPGMVAETVAPAVKVLKETDSYYIHGKEKFVLQNDARALRAAATETDFTFSEATYKCEAHAKTGKYSIRELANQDPQIDIATTTVEQNKAIVMLNKEVRVANLLRANFTVGNGNGKTLAGTEFWNDYDGTDTDPFKNILDAIAYVQLSVGLKPTHIVASTAVWNSLTQHPAWIERIKNTDSRLATDSSIPERVLGLQTLEAPAIVAATEASPFTYVWGDDVFIGYINPKPTLRSMNTVSSFVYSPGEVKRWFDQDTDCYKVRYEQIVTEKVVMPGGGYMIHNVLNGAA